MKKKSKKKLKLRKRKEKKIDSRAEILQQAIPIRPATLYASFDHAVLLSVSPCQVVGSLPANRRSIFFLHDLWLPFFSFFAFTSCRVFSKWPSSTKVLRRIHQTGQTFQLRGSAIRHLAFALILLSLLFISFIKQHTPRMAKSPQTNAAAARLSVECEEYESGWPCAHSFYILFCADGGCSSASWIDLCWPNKFYLHLVRPCTRSKHPCANPVSQKTVNMDCILVQIYAFMASRERNGRYSKTTNHSRRK